MGTAPPSAARPAPTHYDPRTMPTLKITQTRSTIRRPGDQKRTIEALGLGRIGRTVEHEATPQIEGMVRKVKHLVSVEQA